MYIMCLYCVFKVCIIYTRQMVEMYDSLIVYYYAPRLFFLRLNYFLPQTSSFVCTPP